MRSLLFISVISSLLSITLFTSCRQESLHAEGYMQYVEDPGNNLRKSKTIGKYEYILQYRPIEYIAVKESKGNASKPTLERKVRELKGLQYYTLRFSTSGKDKDVLTSDLGSKQEYYGRVSYLSFDHQNDIYMIVGSDTLRCQLYHFENNYGVAPYASIALGFDDDTMNTAATRTVVIDDKIFGNGLIQFEFNKNDINRIPSLITE
jgi:hypothetical protein